jgi:hypothetical protein
MHSSWYWRKRIPDGGFITGSSASAGDDVAVAIHRVRNVARCCSFDSAPSTRPFEARSMALLFAALLLRSVVKQPCLFPGRFR